MDDRTDPGPGNLDGLVLRVRKGDKAAFTDLFVATEREVRIFLSAHAVSADMVDEVLQASYVACYHAIARYEPRGTFLSWLKGIARNLLLKELHDQARTARLESRILEEALARSGIMSAAEGEDPDPAERLRGCLEKLPPHARDLVEKRYAGRASISQLARVVKRSESWVAVTLFRIRESLRACLSS
jgi:RNA polymerase sigma-70 factor (ECF subfamily)